MTRRVRIQLNCQHGRLIDPESEEAQDIVETDTAECLTCPVYLGEYRVEGVTMTGLDALYKRMFGIGFDEYVRVFGRSARHAAEARNRAFDPR